MTGGAGDRLALRHLLGLIDGFKVTEVLRAGVELRVLDQLHERPRSIGELARATGTDVRTLERLVRVLVAVEIVEPTTERETYGLAVAGRLLCGDRGAAPRLRSLLTGDVAARTVEVWRHLGDTVRTGQPAFPKVFGRSFYDLLDADDADGERFYERTGPGGRDYYTAVAWAYDFAGAAVVDVGGGFGGLLQAILDLYPDATGVLFDRPAVITRLRSRPRPSTSQGRLTLHAGDFLAEVPSGGDVYVLSSIVSDFDDDDAATILRVCAAAMAGTARLLVVEELVEDEMPLDFLLYDLQRDLVFGGERRGRAELEALLDRAGLRTVDVHPTWTPLSIIEATRRRPPRRRQRPPRAIADGGDRPSPSG
jgi:hypothetical protein